MSKANLYGKIQTVTGPIDAADQGPSLMHEYVVMDLNPYMLTESGAAKSFWSSQCGQNKLQAGLDQRGNAMAKLACRINQTNCTEHGFMAQVRKGSRRGFNQIVTLDDNIDRPGFDNIFLVEIFDLMTWQNRSDSSLPSSNSSGHFKNFERKRRNVEIEFSRHRTFN